MARTTAKDSAKRPELLNRRRISKTDGDRSPPAAFSPQFWYLLIPSFGIDNGN